MVSSSCSTMCFKKECRMEKARRDTRAWYHKHNAEKEEVYQAGLQAKREAYRAKREAEGKPYSPRYTNRKPKTFASVSSDTEQSLAMETTKVVRKLIESGVDDDVVAKYLQTVYGK